MKEQNKFPDLSTASSTALAKKTVQLNGQKVVFDKKVTLMPVTVEKKY